MARLSRSTEDLHTCQGKQRAFLFKDLREDEKRRHNYTSSQLEMDVEVAACNIQRLFRGSYAREKAAESRDEELIFIGMKPARETGDGLGKELATAYKKRKTEQSDNKEAYAKALVDLKDEVARDEGPQMRDALRQERHLWVTDRIAETKEIPEVGWRVVCVFVCLCVCVCVCVSGGWA